jgi:F0F1-type ATP synthase assembly protein I
MKRVPILAAEMLPARRYWARFLVHLAVGFLVGLVVGGLAEASTNVSGWSLVGGTAGIIAGAVSFILRSET